MLKKVLVGLAVVAVLLGVVGSVVVAAPGPCPYSTEAWVDPAICDPWAKLYTMVRSPYGLNVGTYLGWWEVQGLDAPTGPVVGRSVYPVFADRKVAPGVWYTRIMDVTFSADRPWVHFMFRSACNVTEYSWTLPTAELPFCGGNPEPACPSGMSKVKVLVGDRETYATVRTADWFRSIGALTDGVNICAVNGKPIEVRLVDAATAKPIEFIVNGVASNGVAPVVVAWPPVGMQLVVQPR